MLNDILYSALTNTLKASDIACVKNEQEEYLFRKVITPLRFSSTLLLLEVKLPEKTEFYGEGFQMHSQIGGTFDEVLNIGRYPDDRSPYSPDEIEEYRTAYNYIMLRELNRYYLLGFTSCEKYTGFFRIFKDGTLQVLMNLEGSVFISGDIIVSESFVILSADNRNSLFDHFGTLIEQHHPRPKSGPPPCGWLSRAAYGENYSEKDLMENLNLMRNREGLDYFLIEDGYENHIGDFTDFSDKFTHGFEELIGSVHERGKIPGLWITPFIVSGNSKLIKEHHDWIATDIDGNMTPAGYITYAGFKDTPWYVLDFSNKEVIEYTRGLFEYFAKKLHIRYFKLDACYWGAIKGLVFGCNISRIENYRKGLRIIREAVGDDAFICACNAPLWPSLGLVNAMRISEDTREDHETVVNKTHENFNRMWMGKHLWYCDPDCILIKNNGNNDLSPADTRLLIANALFCRGTFMSGDKLANYTDEDFDLILRIAKTIGSIADIEYSDDFAFIRLNLKNRKEQIQIFMNLSDSQQEIFIPTSAHDYISGAELNSKVTLKDHDALIITVAN